MKLFKFNCNNIKEVSIAYENSIDDITNERPEITKQMIYDKVPLTCIENEDIIMVDGTTKIDIIGRMMKRG